MDDKLNNLKIQIGKGKIEEALEILSNLYLENKLNDDSLLHLKSQFANLKKARIQGVISREDSNLEENKIIQALLAEIDSAKSPTFIKKKRSKYIISFTIVIILIGFLISFQIIRKQNPYKIITTNIQSGILHIDTLSDISLKLAPLREEYCENKEEEIESKINKLNISFKEEQNQLNTEISTIKKSLIKASKYDITLDTIIALVAVSDEVKKQRAYYPTSCYDTIIYEFIRKEISGNARNLAQQVQGEIVDTLIKTYLVCPEPKKNAKASQSNELYSKTWKPYLFSNYLDDLDDNITIKTSYFERGIDCNAKSFYRDRDKIIHALDQLKNTLVKVNQLIQK